MAMKNKSVVAKQPEEAPPPVVVVTPSTRAPMIEDEDEGITAEDQQFLGQSLRFLVNLQKPGMAKIAQANGYTREEHAEGWRLHRAASGQDPALSVVFALSSTTPTAEQAYMPTLRRVDAFENLWFPRTRAIIQRVVPADSRERFEAAFFHELAQQPLGPAVIGSVRTFIARVESLEKSEEPGARAVRETLRKRGLTTPVIAEMKKLLGDVMELAPSTPQTIDEEALAKLRAEQKRAVVSLRAWFNDWATTLRSVFNRKQLIQLGLASPTRAKADEPADPPVDPAPNG